MRWLTIKQVAGILGCSKDRVRKLIRQGKVVGKLELDPKASPYSGNMRWVIDPESITAAAKAAKEKP